VSADPIPPVGARNALGLLWGIITHPRRTMTKLAAQSGRAWILVAATVVLCLSLPILASAPLKVRQAQEQMAAQREQMEQSGLTGKPMPGSAVEVEGGETEPAPFTVSPLITTVLPLVGRLLSLLAAWAVWAGGLQLLTTLRGGRSTFGSLYRMSVWAWLPFAARGLLQTVYIAASGQLVSNPGFSGFVGNPGAAPSLGGSSAGLVMARSMLGHLDLFQVWNLALLVAGVEAFARLPWKKALVLVLALWLAVILLSSLPGLAGSQLAGAGL